MATGTETDSGSGGPRRAAGPLAGRRRSADGGAAGLAASVLALVLVACQSVPPPIDSVGTGEGWRARSGLLRYSGPAGVWIGEVTFAAGGPERFRLEFAKGPGVYLARAWRDGGRSGAVGLLLRGRPGGAASWLALGARLAAAPPGPSAAGRELVELPTGERFDLRWRE